MLRNVTEKWISLVLTLDPNQSNLAALVYFINSKNDQELEQVRWKTDLIENDTVNDILSLIFYQLAHAQTYDLA